MSYKVDIHLHTSENSKCAPHDGYTVAAGYANAGFNGIAVTNHFLLGNRTDLKTIDWEYEVNNFFTGYNHAKEYGDSHNLDVFFGWEYNYNGADLLTYGLGKEWLLAHPDMCSWEIKKYCDEVHNAGGFITHAHPFREAGYFPHDIQLFPRLVDAVETYNGSHEASCFGSERLKWNGYAEWYADTFGLIKLAGSDTHGVKNSGGTTVPSRPGSMRFDRPFSSVQEMIEMIKKGQYVFDCPELFFEELGR